MRSNMKTNTIWILSWSHFISSFLRIWLVQWAVFSWCWSVTSAHGGNCRQNKTKCRTRDFEQSDSSGISTLRIAVFVGEFVCKCWNLQKERKFTTWFWWFVILYSSIWHQNFNAVRVLTNKCEKKKLDKSTYTALSSPHILAQKAQKTFFRLLCRTVIPTDRKSIPAQSLESQTKLVVHAFCEGLRHW